MKKLTLVIGLLGLYGTAVMAVPAPVTDVTTGSTNQRLDEIERLLKTRTNAQHRQQEQLDILQNEVNELRGAIEMQNYQLEKILERQRELYLEIDKRIESVMSTTTPPNQPISTTTAPSYVNAPILPVAEPEPVTASESDAYDKAVNLILKDKKYEQAIPEFQAFLSNYPESSYVPNAKYWLGQLLFNKQDWVGAGEQFQTLINQYPDSSKRADALLKLGITELERANVARAKQVWEQLIQEFPNTSSSKLAQKRLADL